MAIAPDPRPALRMIGADALFCVSSLARRRQLCPHAIRGVPPRVQRADEPDDRDGEQQTDDDRQRPGIDGTATR